MERSHLERRKVMPTRDEFFQQLGESLVKRGLVEPSILDPRNVSLNDLLEPAGIRDRVAQDVAERICVFFCGDNFVIIPAERTSGYRSTINEVRQVADDIEI